MVSRAGEAAGGMDYTAVAMAVKSLEHRQPVPTYKDVIDRVPVRQTIVECGNTKTRRKV